MARTVAPLWSVALRYPYWLAIHWWAFRWRQPRALRGSWSWIAAVCWLRLRYGLVDEEVDPR